MRELCQTHNLVLAPDGKCVLCRRPAQPLFTVREEQQTWINRAFTGLLGAGLLLGVASLFYLSQLGPGYTGGRYETRDPDGAAPTGADYEEPTEAQAPAEVEPEPVAARKPRVDPAALQQVEVTMYATAWCDICAHARAFLHSRNVELIEHDIERSPGAAQKLAALNPALSVPTFEIAGRAYVGFNPWDIEDALHDAARQQPVAARTP